MRGLVSFRLRWIKVLLFDVCMVVGVNLVHVLFICVLAQKVRCSEIAIVPVCQLHDGNEDSEQSDDEVVVVENRLSMSRAIASAASRDGALKPAKLTKSSKAKKSRVTCVSTSSAKPRITTPAF